MYLKIVLIGPCRSGKTVIANFLSDCSDSVSGEYRPTQGVRIVEFETQNLNMSSRGLKAEVELWDCSGDTKFEPLWPAMYKDAHGIVFVYDPSLPGVASELDNYFEAFINESGNLSLTNTKNWLVIKHTKNNDSTNTTLSNNFAKISQVTANVEENGQKLRSDFSNYLAGLVVGVRDRNEQDELNILTVI
ncbi:intraflagellar transport protein 22 homolog [Macrosteles quadrilineatus]|uniref:intraflagellar transport protein 22 homolog n=1 Tax=Macrosteles quadrilineatus TaxID=74068 RepID=UPI0023E25841|nr:intraflagellar transport protein 22 homolog [Macrosteles quadrilineatus]